MERYEQIRVEAHQDSTHPLHTWPDDVVLLLLEYTEHFELCMEEMSSLMRHCHQMFIYAGSVEKDTFSYTTDHSYDQWTEVIWTIQRHSTSVMRFIFLQQAFTGVDQAVCSGAWELALAMYAVRETVPMPFEQFVTSSNFPATWTFEEYCSAFGIILNLPEDIKFVSGIDPVTQFGPSWPPETLECYELEPGLFEL